jgi:hypothetical protein
MATTTQQTNSPGGRTIFALMFFAIGFSLLGNEIKVVHAASTPASQKAHGNPVNSVVDAGAKGVTVSGRIILGGFVATALLVMLSHAGNPGREWAVGLATVTTIASATVSPYAMPVWSELSHLFGSTPTGTTGSTGTASPTHTTSGTSTTGTTSATHATSQTGAKP